MKFKKPLSALVVSARFCWELPARWRPPPTFSSLPTSEVPGGSHTQLTFTTDVPAS